MCLGAEGVTALPYLRLIPYRIKWMSSEWGIKSVCLVSYMPVKSSWLKAILFHFCSPFPEYCWFCGFVLFGALIILSFFTVSCQCMNRFRRRQALFAPPLLPTPVLQVHCSEIWIEIFPTRRVACVIWGCPAIIRTTPFMQSLIHSGQTLAFCLQHS